jgi:GNAT superfamily N-acetyltransferase
MIRRATENDIPQLLEWGERFAEKAQTAEHVGYVADNVEATLRILIGTPQHIILMSDNGAIGAMSGPHPFNHAHIIGQELFWWSEGGGGLRLLAALREWAREHCHSLRVATLAAIEPERTGALYQRLGFAPLENAFIEVYL